MGKVTQRPAGAGGGRDLGPKATKGPPPPRDLPHLRMAAARFHGVYKAGNLSMAENLHFRVSFKLLSAHKSESGTGRLWR